MPARNSRPSDCSGGDRVEDHRDRRRQQDAERAAGGDDPGGEARRIAALAHLRDARRCRSPSTWPGSTRTSPRTARTRTRWRCPSPPGILCIQRVEREYRSAPARDLPIAAPFRMNSGIDSSVMLSQLLVDVLRDGVERRRRHEEVMNTTATKPERERDRHAREHHQQRDAAEQEPEREHAHRSAVSRRAKSRSDVCSSDCRLSKRHADRHQAVRESISGGAHDDDVVMLVDPRLVEQRPRLPREERAEERATGCRRRSCRHAIHRRRQDARQRLDADMAAIRLHVGAAHERRADEQEHRDLVLPVRRGLEADSARTRCT